MCVTGITSSLQPLLYIVHVPYYRVACMVAAKFKYDPIQAHLQIVKHIIIYTEVAFVEGLFCTRTVHLGPGYLAFIRRWLLTEVPLYSLYAFILK